jgi:hypothetical protein
MGKHPCEESSPFDGFAWGHAPFQVTDNQVIAGFCHEYQSFHDRISGFYPGGSTGGDEDAIEALWAQATNQVQWMR